MSLANQATAATDPSKRYKYDGFIENIDKVSRPLIINGKTYKAAVGIKLEKIKKNQRYTGLKFLSSGLNVFFDIKPGTDKKATPTITKMWIVAD